MKKFPPASSTSTTELLEVLDQLEIELEFQRALAEESGLIQLARRLQNVLALARNEKLLLTANNSKNDG
ncbi:MAG: hypothetical protein KF826_15595 [Xanthobacteraceae bacterium]|nr:hypothetical protein [Xanthobacteraceae bacterium]MBX3523177.1 hypothetical protein [Xanthobacteraceae bacterium]MBX3535770.1 hypothetical protein [Xanthobacteraceae bacterium]MBX3548914.1 hypothetical protein [Xanthobacteraceae bacterium]MCW5674545.1 hypothetical protein [Xanthobacteraceae bacterium]